MSVFKRFMHFLSGFMPAEDSGENTQAVKAFHTLISFRELFSAGRFLKPGKWNKWPAVSGHFKVGSPTSPVAVCTLTSIELVDPLSKLNHVAIAGSIYTPNLGIEKIILNITSNPNIRYILLCGKDSSVFHPGQALQSLFISGVNPEKRINNAIGHYPVLGNIKMEMIEAFIKQIELNDCTGETDVSVIQNKIEIMIKHQKTDNKERHLMQISTDSVSEMMSEKFAEIKPGGKRSPINDDKKGFFIITIDQKSKNIIVKHYYTNNQAGYWVKGHSAQSILLALLRENLVSELSHAGYLGAELAKAEASIRLNLSYQQDRPLKSQ